jgi:hypothetical protein
VGIRVCTIRTLACFPVCLKPQVREGQLDVTASVVLRGVTWPPGGVCGTKAARKRMGGGVWHRPSCGWER